MWVLGGYAKQFTSDYMWLCEALKISGVGVAMRTLLLCLVMRLHERALCILRIVMVCVMSMCYV